MIRTEGDGSDGSIDSEKGLPETVFNRTGLKEAKYRIGNFNSFGAALHRAALQSEPLKGWTYHGTDDYGSILFEMWAYVADILTFYQERIANEAWIGTCTRKDSLARLAALVDYQPKPGVSASVYQTFLLEKGRNLDIPAGIRMQSRPPSGKKPQVFETASDLMADWRLNSLPVRGQTVDRPLKSGDRSALLKKGGFQGQKGLMVGDSLLFFLDQKPGNPGPLKQKEAKIRSLRHEDGRLKVEWDMPLFDYSGQIYCHRLLGKMHAFGHDAPSNCIIPHASNKKIPYRTATYNYTGSLIKHWDNAWFIELDGVYNDISTGDLILLAYDDTLPFNCLFTVKSKLLVNAKAVARPEETAAVVGCLKSNSTAIGIITEKTVAEKTVTCLLAESHYTVSTPPESLDCRKVMIYLLDKEEIPFWKKQYGSTIKNGSLIIPSGGLDFSISSLESLLLLERAVIVQDGNSFCIRGTIKSVKPYSDGSETNDNEKDLQVDLLWQNAPPGDICTPAVLFGNVAFADHGETVLAEVLGDGDASAKYQSFTLKKSPMTYVSEPGSASGIKSTLKIYVSNEQWKEVLSFYGKGGKETIFTASLNDAGKMSLFFGDGVNGSRLTTGKNNVIASYRVGLGTAGNIDPLTLSTLLDRPTGIKKAFNPLKAEGGADPESLSLSKENAANRARRLDRIVSLMDYEDVAREYQGVAKARARWIWLDGGNAVHLAVAGQDASLIEGEHYRSLLAHIHKLRDPRCRIILESCKPVYINLEILVETKAGQIRSDVLGLIRVKLLDLYSFDNAIPGRWVRLSDIYSAVQEVPGVLSLKVNQMGIGSLNPNPRDMQTKYIELAIMKDEGLILI